MIAESIDKNSSRNLARELANLRVFFEHGALHYSKYNSLYANESDYDFKYVVLAGTQGNIDLPIEKDIKTITNEQEDTISDGWSDDADDPWIDSEETEIEAEDWTDENGWRDCRF